MERNELITRLVDGIYNAITLEIPRGRLIKGSTLAGTGIAVDLVSTKDNIRAMISNALLLPDGPTKQFRARGQCLIDWSLKVLGDILASLFEEQKSTRERIERMVVRGENDSVPRNLLRHLLWEEKVAAKAIDARKREFDELLTTAKELGFEVLERDENRFRLYLALEISYAETFRDLELRSY
ncbi:MAG: hypothetical protein V1696_02935 [Candidatus Jorgensenbacteria bacterium]